MLKERKSFRNKINLLGMISSTICKFAFGIHYKYLTRQGLLVHRGWKPCYQEDRFSLQEPNPSLLLKAIKDTAAIKSCTREQLRQPGPATNDPSDMQNSHG